MKVFEETTLAGMRLKNRIIRAATYEGLGDAEGFPTEAWRDLYLKLAQGGAGAIITGYAGISRQGKTFPHMVLLDNDRFILPFQKTIAEMKSHGTPMILQLAHGGGMAHAEIKKAPSRQTYVMGNRRFIADELADREIEGIIDGFAAAIRRAREIGFDGVEIHAAHGYLLSEFLSPALNRRNDRWGGTTEKRARILREIIARARENVDKFPVFIKISAYDYQKGGLRLNEAVQLAQLIQTMSYDAIEVSCGNCEWFNTVRPDKIPTEAILAFEPSFRNASTIKKRLMAWVICKMFKLRQPLENYNVQAARTIKSNVDIPVIALGGIRKLSTMEEIIRDGSADYVSMCRPFIIEPDFVERLKSGKQTESRCINCNYCLVGAPYRPMRCYYGKTQKLS